MFAYQHIQPAERFIENEQARPVAERSRQRDRAQSQADYYQERLDERLLPLELLSMLAMGAAIGLAVYFVVSARNDGELPPITVAGGGMAVGAVALLALGAVGALPMHARFGTVEFAGHRTSWLVPVLVAAVGGVLGYASGWVEDFGGGRQPRASSAS